MDVSRCRAGQMPGSGETSPNPVLAAIPAQPENTSAAAGAARTSSGQDRTVLVPGEIAAGRPAPARPLVRAAERPLGPRIAVAPGRFMAAVGAGSRATTVRAWRGGWGPRLA